jgi:hypothetical protein
VRDFPISLRCIGINFSPKDVNKKKPIGLSAGGLCGLPTAGRLGGFASYFFFSFFSRKAHRGVTGLQAAGRP